MISTSTEPAYNLKVVVQETGIEPTTLRAWERRYGLPEPARTSGGHRLYSQRNIEMVKWLMARKDEGMRISQAVDLWRSLEDEGRDPLQAMAYRETERPVAGTDLTSGAVLEGLRETWITACLAFDEPLAEHVVAQAFGRYPPETVCMKMLQKGLSEIGDRWYEGIVTVQQEHFASSLAMRRLNTLIASIPPPSRPERILIGCPPDEEHTFGALLLAFLLRRGGFEVRYLGADLPDDQLQDTVRVIRPQVVILTAQQLATAATLLDVGSVLTEGGVAFGFGGLIFNRAPGVRRRIPGHFLGEDLADAVHSVERMLVTDAPVPEVHELPQAYQVARAHYQRRQTAVEDRVLETLEDEGILEDHLSIGNVHLGRDVAAALHLGDVALVDAELAWLRTLLEHRGIPLAFLDRYLHAYHQAATAHLDKRGRLIIDWLAQVTEDAGEAGE